MKIPVCVLNKRSTMMQVGHIRRDMHTDYRTNFNAHHLITPVSTPLSASSSTINRTPITPQQTMMNYARTPYRYTTVTLLSLRPPSEITIFPDHLVERRFLDEENYIDLDRMLIEKAGKFDLDSFDMRDGPIMPSRIHKYDFSDPAVIEKVKNRRPKDPLTPQQVAALTSVATRHQSSTGLFPHQTPSSHVWIDDHSHHDQVHVNPIRQQPQPSMPYQRQNPNQCEIYTNQMKSHLPTYNQMDEQQTDTIPILQRLFEAQRLQKVDSFPTERDQSGLSPFATPVTPQRSNAPKTLNWLFSSNQNPKTPFSHLLDEHLKNTTIMETPVTPGVNSIGLNKVQRNTKDDDDEQSFYSAPPSPTQQDDPLALFINRSMDKSSFPTALENWFGNTIYENAHPCMPSDHVLAASDLEQ